MIFEGSHGYRISGLPDAVFHDKLKTMVCLNAVDCNIKNKHPEGSFTTKGFYFEGVALLIDIYKVRTALNDTFLEKYTNLESFLEVPIMKNAGRPEWVCVPSREVFWSQWWFRSRTSLPRMVGVWLHLRRVDTSCHSTVWRNIFPTENQKRKALGERVHSRGVRKQSVIYDYGDIPRTPKERRNRNIQLRVVP